jgi:hypothetical protein
MSNNLQKIKLSFDIKGVRELLRVINSSSVDIRNYSFTDDLAFSNETRQSTDFISLIEKDKQIRIEDISYIYNRIYVKGQDFKFNIEVIDITKRSMNDAELDKYTDSLRAGNGLFNVDGAFVSKGKAMELIKKSYEVISISFRFITTLNNKSGFVIEFDYK